MAGPSHYERLGVASDATTAQIRDAYRRLARQLHPDAAAGDAAAMSAINESYRVLADPARRAVYDASLRGGGTPPPTTDRPQAAPTEQPEPLPRAFSDVRVPWKLVITVTAAAIVGVVVLSQFSDPPAEPTPDGVIRAGECVTIDAGGFARDAVCSGDATVDLVVEELVPLDGQCPFGTSAHQDRQGLGIACVGPLSTTPQG